MKLLTLTTSVAELQQIVPVLRDLYFCGQVDGLSIVSSPAEAGLQANPWIHRQFHEYVSQPVQPGFPLDLKAQVAAARRAILEEQPHVVLLPAGSSLESGIHSCLKEAGIGVYTLQTSGKTPLKGLLSELKNRHLASHPRPCRDLYPKALFAEHWAKLGQSLDRLELGTGPCLLLGQQALVKECRTYFPHIEFHDTPESECYSLGLSLLALTFSDRAEEIMRTLRTKCRRALLLEPVNSQLVGARYTLSYDDYDNEFSFTPAEMNLKDMLGDPHTAQVWSQRKGQAGDGALPHPDGNHPVFAATLAEQEEDWTERYRLPQGERLKIVFADSGNVAGSVLHHAAAVNRFTDSEAWALALAPHPLIGPQAQDERNFFLGGVSQVPAEVETVLQQADCFVFFEDDDENSAAWPFPLHTFVAGKPVLHLYIGYRAHQRTAAMQRPGRRILTPLPHIQRMYPQAHFYAGFPPLELLDIALAPPRSQEDGICRILHTPSVPHWTTARYPYHKDTEAFLDTARRLKKRYGAKVEFHQLGGWPQAQIHQARQACDITFNSLRGFHGLSGDEAMFLERPCVQAFDRANVNRHREYWGLKVDFPWVTAQRDDLEQVFCELIDQPARRAEIGQASRVFMLKYFSPQKGILPLLYHCYQTIKGS